MQVEEFRRASYATAEALAPSWERRRGFVERVSAPVREWMLEELAPAPGDVVLELAAGAGDTGFEAARLVGGGGRVLSTDFSPAMVDVARRRAAELGLDNVEFRVVDAERIELDDDSVDGVLCRFGYMLMADPAAALAGARRVLRAGGRHVLAVWGAPERNPLFVTIGMTLVEQGHLEPPDPRGPGITSMGSAERTRSLLEGAGFAEIRLQEIPVVFAFADIEECFAVMADTAGVLALALRELGEPERAAVTAALEGRFAQFRTPAGYEIPGVALGAVAS